MKTKEELNALKAEVETLNKKLAELSEEELEQVSGGVPHWVLTVFDEKYKRTIGFDNRTTWAIED